MPTLEFFLVCESVSVDQSTNTLSVFHVFDDIRAHTLPTIVPRLVAVCSLLIGAEERGRSFAASLRVRSPRGDVQDLPMTFRAHGRRQRLLTQLVGMGIDTIGEVSFELMIDGQRVAAHSILVELGAGAGTGTIPPAVGSA